MKEDVMAKLDLLIGMSAEPSGPSARIDAAASRVSEQSERVATIRAALRRMLAKTQRRNRSPAFSRDF